MTAGCDQEAAMTQIRQFVESQFLISLEDGDLTVNSDLFAAGIVDSYGLIELVTFIEKSFDIQLNEADTLSQHLASVAGITHLVLAKKGST